MSDDSPTPVRDEDTGDFGLYYPERDVIEFNADGEMVELGDVEPGVGVASGRVEADEDDLTASIEADIAETREEIAELREQELTYEQEQELERLESRLEGQENVLELHKGVRENAE